LLLQRGLAAFGAGLALLPPLHAHASLLAFASRHNAPKQVKARDVDLREQLVTFIAALKLPFCDQ